MLLTSDSSHLLLYDILPKPIIFIQLFKTRTLHVQSHPALPPATPCYQRALAAAAGSAGDKAGRALWGLSSCFLLTQAVETRGGLGAEQEEDKAVKAYV